MYSIYPTHTIMIIQSIYDRYQIPPHLQLHMLRVAAVAQTICDHRRGDAIDRESIIAAALLHDMGNIVKFNMDLYPELWEPEGVTYRKEIQQSFKKYGKTEYEATYKIISLESTNKKLLKLIYDFDHLTNQQKFQIKDIQLYILDYADACVTPHEITSISKRTDDFVRRNMKNKQKSYDEARAISDKRLSTLKKMQQTIFEQVTIEPEMITDQLITPLLDPLRTREIPTT